MTTALLTSSSPVYTQAMISAWPVVNAHGVIAGGDEAGRSGALSVLGSAGSVPFEVYPVSGARVLYYNHGLAQRLGLPVAPGHVVTPNVAAYLVDRFALRVDGDNSKRATTLHATRYGQTEINGGDGRAGMDERENLLSKGVGVTPLVATNRRGREVDYTHSNGWLVVHTSLTEAYVGEALHNLMDGLSPRTVALLGLNNKVIADRKFPNPEPAAILVRSGLQIRPAHFVESDLYVHYGKALVWLINSVVRRGSDAQDQAARAGNIEILKGGNGLDIGDVGEINSGHVSPEAFLRTAHGIGVLQYRECKGEILPDFVATIRVMMDLMAQTNAAQFRWRILHGSPTASNAQLDGALLDFSDVSSNPRTGVIATLPYCFPFGDAEYQARAIHFKMLAHSLRVNMSVEEADMYHLDMNEIDFMTEYREMFDRHLDVQMLRATGFKRELAKDLTQTQGELAARYRSVLYRLGTVGNPGEVPSAIDKDGRVLPDSDRMMAKMAVVDVFGMLGRLAGIYFADPTAVTVDRVEQLLEPYYLGDADEQRTQVRALVEEFVALYPQIMAAGLRDGLTYYDDASSMSAAIAEKARFESAPLTSLYFWRNREELLAIVDDPAKIDLYLTDPVWVSNYINGKAARAKRNMDALVQDGDVLQVDEDTWDVGITTLDHVTYGVRANLSTNDRSLIVSIPVEARVDGDGGFTSNVLPQESWNALDDFPLLRFSLEEGGSEDTVRPKIVRDSSGIRVVYNIPVQRSQAGLLRAMLVSDAGNSVALNLYPFAVPDNRDAARLIDRVRRAEELSDNPADTMVVSAITSAGGDTAGDEQGAESSPQ